MVGERCIVVHICKAKLVEDGNASVNLARLQFVAPPAYEIALLVYEPDLLLGFRVRSRPKYTLQLPV